MALPGPPLGLKKQELRQGSDRSENVSCMERSRLSAASCNTRNNTVSDETNRWHAKKQMKRFFHAVSNQASEPLQQDIADFEGVRGFSWSPD